jgi:hypothetical protein
MFAWAVLNFNLWAHFFFLLLVIPFYILSLVISLVHLVRKRRVRAGVAVMPLMVNILTVALAVWPFNAFVERFEFAVHYEARMEVVQRIQNGELWDGSPMHGLAYLPSEYPPSVSGSAEYRAVAVHHVDDSLQVVFRPAKNTLLGESSALLYNSNGQPPTLPNKRLPNSTLSESWGNGWYRITQPAFLPGLLRIVWGQLTGIWIVD